LLAGAALMASALYLPVWRPDGIDERLVLIGLIVIGALSYGAFCYGFARRELRVPRRIYRATSVISACAGRVAWSGAFAIKDPVVVGVRIIHYFEGIAAEAGSADTETLSIQK
jgi:hypothetical protein